MGYLSRPFRGSQERLVTVDKDGSAIVSTFKLLPYLLRGGVSGHCNRGNLTLFFCENPTPTTKVVHSVHIRGDEKCWRDQLSRWVTRPMGLFCVHASVNYTEGLFAGSDKRPTEEVVRMVQAAAAEGGPTLDTALGVAWLDFEALYRMEKHGHHVIWVPAGAESPKKRPVMDAHVERD